MQSEIAHSMRTFQGLGDWMNRGFDDSVPPEMLEMVGEGAQRETETRKIRGRVIVQAKIALKAVDLLENWHEKGPVARRTIERALFPQMGPSARLVAQFLFGACSCLACEGKTTPPVILSALDQDLMAQWLCERWASDKREKKI